MDPGWNDPPMLNYSSSNPPPKSRITNKRVAFPLNISSTKSQEVSLVNSPNLGSIPPMTKTQMPSEIVDSKSNLSGELLKETVYDISVELLTFIKNEEDRQIFLNLWREDKFPSCCKEDITLLCRYLNEGKMENVISIKTKLLTEYKELCDIWIKSIQV